MGKKDKTPPRSRGEIEADMAARRASLASGVGELFDQVYPPRVMQREVARVKNLAKSEFQEVKSQFVRPDGSPRLERIAVIGGAVVGVVTFFMIIRAVGRGLASRRR